MLYADFNATAPLSPSVFARMRPYLEEEFGNPSSTQSELGKKARAAVEEARAEVAALVGAEPEEIIFLSGGTESCFHALAGLFGPNIHSVYRSAVEHPCVSEALVTLHERFGANIETLPVTTDGALRQQSVDSIQPRSIVSVMTANNETGILFPVSELAQTLGSREVLVHTDAVQAVGKIPITFSSSSLTALSLSAHKFGGPKGIGALVLRRGTLFRPLIRGGGQERGLRGGTEAVALIVGMGEAARQRSLALAKGLGVGPVRDSFETELQRQIPSVQIHGQRLARLPNTSCISIPGLIGGAIVQRLVQNDIIVSAGAACKSGALQPSAVLTAMSVPAEVALGTVRVSFALDTTEAEMRTVLTALCRVVAELERA